MSTKGSCRYTERRKVTFRAVIRHCSDKGLTLETSVSTFFTVFSVSTSTRATLVFTGTSIPFYGNVEIEALWISFGDDALCCNRQSYWVTGDYSPLLTFLTVEAITSSTVKEDLGYWHYGCNRTEQLCNCVPLCNLNISRKVRSRNIPPELLLS